MKATKPPTYTIKDTLGEPVQGIFYEQELKPADINGLARKLQLLAAEFFAGNTTDRNELVHVLDTLLRLKQLTRKEYTNITARLAASL